MSDSCPSPSFERDIFPADVRAVMENPGDTVVTLHAIEHTRISTLLMWRDEAAREGYKAYGWAQEHKALCGYPLLWSSPLPPEVASRELRALLDGVDTSDDTAMMCFDPRHVFSFDIDGTHYDLVVCYSCDSVELWRNGECVQTLQTARMSFKAVEALVIGAGIRRRLDSMPFSEDDTKWMRQALELAARGSGYTSPNPRVGSVIVRDGVELGAGWHKKAGTPHAEVNAVRDAKARGYADLSGATIYVTLEPCCTHGRTPPCTDLILRECFARVVVAAVDPNPWHAGHGLDILRDAGIQVESGLLFEESEYLNRDFNHFMRTGLPWVTAKMALSLDGSIAPRRGDSPWLTSAQARRHAHVLRHLSDAIVVGAGTVRADNPRLTIRLDTEPATPDPKPQPWRVVLTRSDTFPSADSETERNAALFTDEHRDRTIVLRNADAEPLRVLRELASRQAINVLLEGGGQVLGAFFQAGLVNEVAFFLAPVLLGTSSPAVVLPSVPTVSAFPGVSLHHVTYKKLGPDILMQGLIRPSENQ